MSRRLIARLFRRPPEPGEPVPDAELLARYADTHDEAAFELLVWRHAAMVLGVCRRAVGDEHRADDAFQAVFLVLARKAGSVRGSNLAGWLFRVARRVSKRAAAVEQRRREEPLRHEPLAAPPPCPAENRESLAVLDAEIARLPDRLRRPLLLCYLGGHTTEDAARALGCPRGTVLSRLAAARAKLADRLTRRGVTLPAAAVGLSAGPGSLSAVVPPTARAVTAFLGRVGDSVHPSFVLANGVIRAMKLSKLMTAAGSVVLVGGVCAGYVMLAEAGRGGGTARAADPPAKTAEPPKPPTEQERKREQLNKLEVALESYRPDIEANRKRIQVIRESVGVVTPGLGELEEAVGRGRLDRERELLVTEIRELSKDLRDIRRQRQATADELTPEAAQRQQAMLDKRAALIREEIAQLRAKLDALENEHLDRVRRTARDRATYQAELDRLAREVEQREQLAAEVTRQIERLKLELAGVSLPDTPSPAADPRLNEILREVKELRREVQELKRK